MATFSISIETFSSKHNPQQLKIYYFRQNDRPHLIIHYNNQKVTENNMVASIIVSNNNKETNTNKNSSKVSLSYSFDSNYEKETFPLISKTKKHIIMELTSSMFDVDDDLPRTPKTPKTSHSSLIDEDEWSFYNMAPILKKQILYMSDDWIRNAPQVPRLEDDDDSSIVEKINLTRLAPRFTLFLNDDCVVDVPRLPTLDDDDSILEDNDNEKENTPPSTMMILLPRFYRKESKKP